MASDCKWKILIALIRYTLDVISQTSKSTASAHQRKPCKSGHTKLTKKRKKIQKTALHAGSFGTNVWDEEVGLWFTPFLNDSLRGVSFRLEGREFTTSARRPTPLPHSSLGRPRKIKKNKPATINIKNVCNPIITRD